jgi:short-subunit dehydrogenase
MKKIVFITGASSGIGEAFVHHYAKQGARLGLMARREAELVRVANVVKGGHGATREVSTFPCDVSDASSMQKALQVLTAECGVPDVVIANAGVSRGTLAGAPEDMAAFKEVFETNVLGLVHTFTPVIEAMVQRGSGTLVGIASVAGLRGIPGSAAYSASKAAAIAYCEALRVELRGTGVKVVTVCPGYIDTPMTQVNTFTMPFLMTPEAGARRMARVIDAQRAFAVVPWQMSVIGRAMRALPIAVYDRILARMPRKPRNPR